MRNETADRLKGLCIALMVVGHCLIPDAVHDAIYLFHMPVFFFVAGYFFKPGPALQRLRTDSRRLLVPYGIAVALVCLRYGVDVLRGVDADVLLRFAVSAVLVGPGLDFASWKGLDVGPVWFLASLFWSRTLFNLLVRMRYGVPVAATLGIAASVAGPVLLCLPFGISQGIAGLFFFAAGHEASRREVLAKGWVLPVSCAGAIPAIFIPSMDMHPDVYPCLALNLLVSLFAVMLLWKLFSYAEKSRFFVLAFLSSLGRLSLLVLVIHYFEAMTFYWNDRFAFLPIAGLVMLRLCIDIAVAFALSRIPPVRQLFGIK